MPTLELTFDSGERSLSVSRFSVKEGISSLFTVSIWALSDDPAIDLDSIVGKGATFRIDSGAPFSALGGIRRWTGICQRMQLARPEAAGKSTYHLRIVPALWLLTERRGHRIFQNISIPDILGKLLQEWSIAPVWNIDRTKYPKLEFKVQYGENDFDFLCRLAEEAGIAFTFPEDPVNGTRLVFDDNLTSRTPRPGLPLHYTDNPSGVTGKEIAVDVRLKHHVRPGAHVIRDYDMRNPSFNLLGEAPKSKAPEDRYEQFEYDPGAFLIASTGGAETPGADDRGPYRHVPSFGTERATRALAAERALKRVVQLATNTVDLWPGVVFFIEHHPHPELPAGAPLLLRELLIQGTPGDVWYMEGSAVPADVPYLPPRVTPHPRIHGIQSALVVGPHGQQIHVDELGRVRVQFHWDREGHRDEGSSVWIRVSHGWAGAGFGVMALPRIGQEVLVAFLDGDPDDPVIVNRAHNMLNPVPYRLPESKTRSTFKSDTSPGSLGWNEILFEDVAGDELVYQQAQKNLRRLVKRDEVITVVHDREKQVQQDERDKTVGNRVEHTKGNRTETVHGDRTTAVEKNLKKLIKVDEIERIEQGQLTTVDKDRDTLVEKVRRELVHLDSHVKVEGSRNESVGGESLSDGSQQEKIGCKSLLETCLELHEKAGNKLVAEGASDVTIKGPGGFIRIDAGGVTIQGTLVLINAGGSPGSAGDAKPGSPEEPKEADVTPPKEPEVKPCCECPTKAEFKELGTNYGFDDFTNAAVPWKSVELARTDTVKAVLTPAGKAANVTFKSSDTSKVLVAPPRASADDQVVVVEGVANGEVEITAECGGATLGKMKAKAFTRKTKTVAIRLVHEKNYKSTDVSDAAIKGMLEDIYKQAVFEFKVVRLPAMTVDFDIDGDGQVDVNSWMSAEMIKIRDAAKDDSYDHNIFLVDNPNDGSTGFMSFNQRYGFIHGGTSPNGAQTLAHELGHGAFGLQHTPADATNVMEPAAEAGGGTPVKVKLRKDQWDKINP